MGNETTRPGTAPILYLMDPPTESTSPTISFDGSSSRRIMQSTQSAARDPPRATVSFNVVSSFELQSLITLTLYQRADLHAH